MITCYVMTALLLVPSAAPPTAGEHLDRAIALESELEYERAEEELLSVITSPSATEDELIAANLLAGIVKRVLGNTTEARLHFLYVLKRRPETQLEPSRSPKIRAFFQLVREEVGADQLTDAKTLDQVSDDTGNLNADVGGSLLTPRDEDRSGAAKIDDDSTTGTSTTGTSSTNNAAAQPLASSVTSTTTGDDVANTDASSPMPALVGGGVLAATGLTVAIASIGGALFVDNLFFNGGRIASERETLRLVSRALIATTTVGTLAAAGGAGMMALGAFE